MAPVSAESGTIALQLEGDGSGCIRGAADLSVPWELIAAAGDVAVRIVEETAAFQWRDALAEDVAGRGNALAAFLAALAVGKPRSSPTMLDQALQTLALTLAVEEALAHGRSVQVAEVLARDEVVEHRPLWRRVLGHLRI